MNTTQHTETTRPAPTADPVYLENTLLRVFGVLFCHDAKRARTRTGKSKSIAAEAKRESRSGSIQNTRSRDLSHTRSPWRSCASNQASADRRKRQSRFPNVS